MIPLFAQFIPKRSRIYLRRRRLRLTLSQPYDSDSIFRTPFYPTFFSVFLHLSFSAEWYLPLFLFLRLRSSLCQKQLAEIPPIFSFFSPFLFPLFPSPLPHALLPPFPLLCASPPSFPSPPSLLPCLLQAAMSLSFMLWDSSAALLSPTPLPPSR